MPSYDSMMIVTLFLTVLASTPGRKVGLKVQGSGFEYMGC